MMTSAETKHFIAKELKDACEALESHRRKHGNKPSADATRLLSNINALRRSLVRRISRTTTPPNNAMATPTRAPSLAEIDRHIASMQSRYIATFGQRDEEYDDDNYDDDDDLDFASGPLPLPDSMR